MQLIKNHNKKILELPLIGNQKVILQYLSSFLLFFLLISTSGFFSARLIVSKNTISAQSYSFSPGNRDAGTQQPFCPCPIENDNSDNADFIEEVENSDEDHSEKVIVHFLSLVHHRVYSFGLEAQYFLNLTPVPLFVLYRSWKRFII